VESQALLMHVQEPHAHRARPHHQADKLSIRNSEKHYEVITRGDAAYKVDLDEELPIRQPIRARIARLAQHEV
jgi:hypothetical protein